MKNNEALLHKILAFLNKKKIGKVLIIFWTKNNNFMPTSKVKKDNIYHLTISPINQPTIHPTNYPNNHPKYLNTIIIQPIIKEYYISSNQPSKYIYNLLFDQI